jgi:hypothetical protein
MMIMVIPVVMCWHVAMIRAMIRGHMRVMHRLSMSRPMISTAVSHVVSHVGTPIRVGYHVPLETVQPHRIANDPGIVRSQIVVLAANHTHVLVTVPNVIVRNSHRHRYCRHGRCRS